ncbi:MAG: sigma-54-dependent Fis family transcriptional regulator [Burkholderiales bacterium]|nr:MAG: sigma-54-dependent Fis family transcriptional regulator [Burkholderiales bacterium]
MSANAAPADIAGSAASLPSPASLESDPVSTLNPGTSAPSDRQLEGWPDWSILVVDDEQGMLNFLVKTLAPRCRFVMSAGSAEEGAEWLAGHHADLIILDISLPGASGVSWLKELREHGYTGEVILITAFADLETAIEALRAGASDFILKPFRVPQILNAVKQCHERARLRRENFVLRRAVTREARRSTALIGSSPQMQALRAAMDRVAAVDSTVLLQGESGTGKELVARELHARSPRAAGPFVPVNCAAISPELIESELFGHAKGAFTGASRAREGLFHYAQGGTLFLDEISELPLPIQAALLRAIEDHNIRPVGSQQQVPLNLRVIAATNRRLSDEVAKGRFRQDLYFRLQVVDLRLPPLREHKADIPVLVGHFIEQMAPALGADTLGVSDEEMAFLVQYDWPGNVRELRNLIERSLILGALNVSALYPAQTSGSRSEDPLPTDLHALEKRHILSVLESVQGDKTRAAQLLGVSRRTLERRVAEWGATPSGY